MASQHGENHRRLDWKYGSFAQPPPYQHLISVGMELHLYRGSKREIILFFIISNQKAASSKLPHNS